MANILLLDSPVGSGFSFARDPKGYDVGDYSSSSQVQTFLNKVMRGMPYRHIVLNGLANILFLF